VKGSGTPGYRAPELVEKSKFTEPAKCDVYSAGIMLFMLLTNGRLPYEESFYGYEAPKEDQEIHRALHYDTAKFWELQKKRIPNIE